MTQSSAYVRFTVALIFWVGASACQAQNGIFSNESPKRTELPGLPQELSEVGFDQLLGEQVPLGLRFTNSEGSEIQLSDLVKDKPVILTLVYYECPMLCNMIINGMLRSLRVLKFDIGKEFDIVTVSFDPEEKSALAAEKKKNYLQTYERQGAESGWHFLTGSTESIAALTQSVGFRYKFEPETDEFAHASGIVVLTPEGKIARYLYGIDFDPKDLRFSLIEASDNKIGNVIDQALLFCFRYNPLTGAYSAVVLNIVKLAGIATLLGLGALLFFLRRHDLKSKPLSKKVA